MTLVKLLFISFRSAQSLHALLCCRENDMFMELGKKMRAAGKEGRFETWCYKEQDLVQGAARAYGERLASECFSNTIKSADPELQPILEKLHFLFLLNVVEKSMGR